MRKVSFSLVLAACVWALAPGLDAGGEKPAVRLAPGQWRILPHAPFRRPVDEEIHARFTRQIEPLGPFFKSDPGEAASDTIADALLDAKVRNQLFRLESLLRLYKRAFPDLDKYLVSVKEIEDGIGDYSYAVDSLKFAEDQFRKEDLGQAAGATRTAEREKILSGLRRKRDRARVVFANLLEESSLASDLPRLQSQLGSTLVGWRPGQDLEYVNAELQQVLKDVRDGHYDFNKLEDGIHEYRRRLRWFPMMIDSLDGLIMLRDDPPGACPVPSLQALAGTRAATHRYANPALSFPATRPCTISRCLLWPVVKSIDDIGRLKDTAEGNAAVEAALEFEDDNVRWSNKVTPEEIAQARTIRDELLSSKAIDSLMGQLASCKP